MMMISAEFWSFQETWGGWLSSVFSAPKLDISSESENFQQLKEIDTELYTVSENTSSPCRTQLSPNYPPTEVDQTLREQRCRFTELIPYLLKTMIKLDYPADVLHLMVNSMLETITSCNDEYVLMNFLRTVRKTISNKNLSSRS